MRPIPAAAKTRAATAYPICVRCQYSFCLKVCNGNCDKLQYMNKGMCVWMCVWNRAGYVSIHAERDIFMCVGINAKNERREEKECSDTATSVGTNPTEVNAVHVPLLYHSIFHLHHTIFISSSWNFNFDNAKSFEF